MSRNTCYNIALSTLLKLYRWLFKNCIMLSVLMRTIRIS